jgi:hypothetical protein
VSQKTEDWNDPRQIALDQAKGLLESIEFDPYDPFETVEALSLWQELKRFVWPEGDPLSREAQKTMDQIYAALKERPIEGDLSHAIQPDEWIHSFQNFVQDFEELCEYSLDSGRSHDQNALGLFEQLDQWQLAIHGALQLCPEASRLLALKERLEKELLAKMMESLDLFVGLGPLVEDVIYVSRTESQEDEDGLAETLDLYFAVQHAVNQMEDPSVPIPLSSLKAHQKHEQKTSETARGWRPSLLACLPPKQRAYAAQAEKNGPNRFFKWEDDKTKVFAFMLLKVKGDLGEESLQTLQVTDPEGHFVSLADLEVRCFGLAGKLSSDSRPQGPSSGCVSFSLKALREALQASPKENLLIQGPEGSLSLPLVATYED